MTYVLFDSEETGVERYAEKLCWGYPARPGAAEREADELRDDLNAQFGLASRKPGRVRDGAAGGGYRARLGQDLDEKRERTPVTIREG